MKKHDNADAMSVINSLSIELEMLCPENASFREVLKAIHQRYGDDAFNLLIKLSAIWLAERGKLGVADGLEMDARQVLAASIVAKLEPILLKKLEEDGQLSLVALLSELQEFCEKNVFLGLVNPLQDWLMAHGKLKQCSWRDPYHKFKFGLEMQDIVVMM